MSKFNNIPPPSKRSLLFFFLFLVLAVTGHFLFAQFGDYEYLSDRHIADIFRAKFWSLLLILIFSGLLYWKRDSDAAPLLAVFGVSLYYIVIYSIMLRGTEYGFNGHWGDNGYRLAIVNKMMHYNYFADAYMKDLTSMYPPLYFFLCSLYAKLVGLEAWQTLKFGYNMIFLIYPWLVYFSWKPLVSKPAAAAVAVASMFIGYHYIYYIYYEHLAAALFLPWWLYYFEDAGNKFIGRRPGLWRYMAAILIGSAIFLTYYYWFFIAVILFPITVLSRYIKTGSARDVMHNVRHKVIVALGIAWVTSIYWFPLIYSGIKRGFTSFQIKWFGLRHADLTLHWEKNTLEGALILAGIFFAAYLWRHWKYVNIAYFMIGAALLVIIDRVVNTGHSSIQTRKILEFTHVFCMAPLAIGSMLIWKRAAARPEIRYGLAALGIAIFFIYANEHVALYEGNLYQTGIKQRYPSAKLAMFDEIDCRNKVIWTNRYIECCYLPYFLFNPVSNTPAHLAGQFYQRMDYLEQVSKINSEELLAYVLSHNKFDRIDYVFLPLNKKSNRYEFITHSMGFNQDSYVFDTIAVKSDVLEEGNFFKKINEHGLFEVTAPARSRYNDSLISTDYPGLEKYLAGHN